MIVDRSQRWRRRQDTFVPSSSRIDPSTLSVDIVDCHRVAKPFVEEHHYSGSFPASRLSVGLFANGGGGSSRLVGVATFSQPMNNASVPLHSGLVDPLQGADLGRLVLLDEVAGNGETWFLSRAMRALRQEKPSILSVVSYADPVTRRAPCGALVKPGHVGSVYAVMGAAYRGRTKPRSETVTPDGQLFSERALTKIRNAETGHRYATEQLLARGAPAQGSLGGREWIARLCESRFLSKRRHSGNHVYVFEMTKAAKIAGRHRPRLAYPVLDRTFGVDDVTSLPLLTTRSTP